MIRTKPFDLARLFAALADPTRLRLLNLMHGREVCVCYFVKILQQSQPKISRHLAYLRKAGVASARREGKWMHYSIQRPQDATAALILDTVLRSLKGDKRLQSDLMRLDRACCSPEKFIALERAPSPVQVLCGVPTHASRLRRTAKDYSGSTIAVPRNR